MVNNVILFGCIFYVSREKHPNENCYVLSFSFLVNSMGQMFAGKRGKSRLFDLISWLPVKAISERLAKIKLFLAV